MGVGTRGMSGRRRSIEDPDPSLALIQLVRNPKMFEDRINSLREAEESANEARLKLVKARNIDKYHSEALADRKQAQEELEAAQARAAGILREAYDAISEKRTETDQYIRDERNSLEKERSVLRRRAEDLDARSSKIVEREKAIEERTMILNKRQEELDATMAEYNEKVRRLQEAINAS